MKMRWAMRRFQKSVQDYGWQRALAKASGRLGYSLHRKKGGQAPKTVSVIGCGQAAYATICFFIAQKEGNIFLDCYDPNKEAAYRLQSHYGFARVTDSAAEIFQNSALQHLIVASNHASHTSYAVEALERGIHVFCEKPLCTTQEQLVRLDAAVQKAPGKLWAGFNRPWSTHGQLLRDKMRKTKQPLTMHAYVHGHFLPAEHWYRQPEEGTRISGNMGHWIDFAVHLMAARGALPETFTLTLCAASPTLPKDDNVVLVMTTDFGDLVSISLNARHEPFGGIRETIELQCGDFAAQILDFKTMHCWQGSQRETSQLKHKDVGHKATTLLFLEPGGTQRDWQELRLSTALTLHASDLARRADSSSCTVNSATLALEL
jgi:predicted dehydrogenase